MRRAAALLALALALPAAGAAAQEAICPPRAPRVQVTVQDPNPRTFADRGVAQLMADSGLAPGLPAHQLGVTASRVEWRSEMDAAIGRPPDGADGPVCALPGAVTVILVHAEHAIRIAREIPRDGCLWQEVLGHEQRHAQVNRRTLRDAAARTREAVTAWAQRAEARGASVDAAGEVLRAGLREAIVPVLARMQSEREAAHAQIDTPEEYRRLGQVCALEQVRLRDVLTNPGPAPRR